MTKKLRQQSKGKIYEALLWLHTLYRKLIKRKTIEKQTKSRQKTRKMTPERMAN